jgi:hypothetical protein
MRHRSPVNGLAAMLVALALSFTSIIGVPAAAQDAPSATAAPGEIDGQINGKKARFVAQGDDVLVSAAEADRIGLSFRDGKSLSIGGTPVWIVTLGSVTAAGRTRLVAPAGVVPSIPAYFAALRAHPAEALARSREIRVGINGRTVLAYDLGDAGVLLAPDVADGAGLKYREGKRQDVGATRAWVVEMTVTVRAQESATTVIVAEPQAYFEALMAAAGRSQ